MHTSFAVSTKGLPLGILHQNIFARIQDTDKTGKKDRRLAPIQEKEGMKWLTALAKSHNPLKSSNTHLVTVCDRESDMYDFFEAANQNDSSVLVRASHNRVVGKTSNSSEEERLKLWELVQKTPSQSTIEVVIPSQRNQKERIASLDLHYTEFTMNPPKNKMRKNRETLPSFNLYAVYVVEKNPPEVTKPLEWMLLTNVEVTSEDEALEKIKWYRLRWRIEVFHKVLKSGLQVENCRLGSADRLIRYLTIMSIIAYRIYFVTLIGRTQPNTPCDILLSQDEWQVLYTKKHRTRIYPASPPPLKEVMVWIAELGGFLARKNDGNPGQTTMWRGWGRLADLVEGWKMANADTYG